MSIIILATISTQENK
ncbi:hypothetical protein Q5468_01630 [Escherichia coli]|nr:hypothetical protein [Escherichia coli]MED8266081.1 hypothetical protein [Escherichia coli]